MNKKQLTYVRGEFDLMKAQNRFQEVFARQMQLTRKDARKQFKTEAKGVMRFVFAVTPPMGGKQAAIRYGKNIRVDFASGRRAGRINIVADIKKVFKSSRNSQFSSASEALSFYLRQRNSEKRVQGASRVPTSREIIAEVRRAVLQRQGWVPSGWNAAAAGLGFRAPAWISKWGNALSQKFTAIWESDTPFFEAVNGTSHKDSDSVSRRIAIAINQQSNTMERRMKALAERELKRALG